MFSSFFRGRDSEQLSPATPLQAQRSLQIETLKRHNLSFLPPSFPHEPPVVKVTPPVNHPWVDPETQQIVGSPRLIAFSMHSDLGRIVQSVISEFQTHPPEVLSPNIVQTPYLTSSGLSVSQDTCPYVVNGCIFPALKEMSIPELENIKEEKELDNYLEDLPEVKQLYDLRHQLVQQNEELACENLGKKPIIEEHKKELLEKLEEFQSLRKEFDDASQMFDMFADAYTPSTLGAFRVATLQAEEESDKVAEMFLSRALTTEEFLKRFTELKILAHQRRSKEERLQRQLLELQKAGI
ncbi:vacuolar protein sorting-associated protein 37A-like isoform X2 [Tachypleus tridentatus]|uniref:vacuolar protein sorting-associated protein 37A-like isoform X2 n=1 Tax=Tachypleus tridentatus TaxID=6853 RepID=UPI003FD1D80D